MMMVRERGAASQRNVVFGALALVLFVGLAVVFFRNQSAEELRKAEFYSEEAERATRERLALLNAEPAAEPTPAPVQATPTHVAGRARFRDRPTTQTFDMEQATAEFLAMMADPAKMREAQERAEAAGRIRRPDKDDDEEPAEPATVEGYVTTTDGEDVGGAVVDALGMDSTTTAANGYYTLAFRPRGQVMLRVMPPEGSNLAPARPQMLSLRAGATTRVDFKLDAGWSLDGHVVDEQDNPIADANVTAFLGGIAVARTSDSGGFFRIEGVPAGGVVQQMAVVREGYLAATRESLAEMDGPQRFVLKREKTAPLLVVWASSGAPVLRYRYAVTSDGPSQWTSLTGLQPKIVESPDGRTTIRSLGEGAWRVEVTALDEGQRLTRLRQSRTFSIPASGDAAEVVVEISPGQSVAGVVVEQDGAPAVGASVGLRPSEGRVGQQTARTGEDGQFTFQDVQPGSYFLDAVLGQRRTGDAVPVDVTDGTAPPFERLELAAGGRIHGVVLDEAGAPAVGAAIRFRPEVAAPGGRPVMTVPVDAEGRYSIDGVGPGSHELAVNFKTPERAVRRVTVEAGEEREENFNLADVLKLSGFVSANGVVGNDVVTHLMFHPTGSTRGKRALVNPDGRYEVEIEAGAYDLRAQSNNQTEGRIGLLELAAQPVVQERNVDVTLADMDIVVVFPTDTDFTPGYLEIEQQGSPPSMALRRSLDQDRRRLNGMIRGEYRARFSGGGWAGSTGWVSIQPGGENVILIEVARTN